MPSTQARTHAGGQATDNPKLGVAPASPRLHARLALNFERSAAIERTLLSATVQEPPLRVIRAFQLPDGAALVHLHNVSGGLLGGDTLELLLRVGPAAAAQLTTTGATRIYRPRAGATPATQLNDFVVEENGLLEYVPDPLIPYRGSRWEQTTSIRLGRGAGLFWWEVVAPGREANGENFDYEYLAWRTDLTIADRLVAAERVRIEPARLRLDAPGRLARHRYVVTFLICREGLTTDFWGAAEERLREVAGGLDDGAAWGVSTLVAHGLIVRCLARSGVAIQSGLRSVWRAAKEMIYGREAVWPRKVN